MCDYTQLKAISGFEDCHRRLVNSKLENGLYRKLQCLVDCLTLLLGWVPRALDHELSVAFEAGPFHEHFGRNE